MALRVGAVSYLNAKPLYYRLEEFAPDVRLTMDYPSVLAEKLANGELDVALIPSIEYLRGTDYEILPGSPSPRRGRCEVSSYSVGSRFIELKDSR